MSFRCCCYKKKNEKHVLLLVIIDAMYIIIFLFSPISFHHFFFSTYLLTKNKQTIISIDNFDRLFINNKKLTLHVFCAKTYTRCLIRTNDDCYCYNHDYDCWLLAECILLLSPILSFVRPSPRLLLLHYYSITGVYAEEENTSACS